MCVSVRNTALSAVLILAAGSASAACQVYQALQLDVDMHGLRPRVAVNIEGTEVQLLLDSGGFYNMLSPATAEKLKLHPVETREKPSCESVSAATTIC